MTPLGLAIKLRKNEISTVLYNNPQIKKGHLDLLDISLKHENMDVAKMLLEDLDPNSKDDEGNTVLHILIIRNQLQMFFTNLQLSKNVLKVDPNIKNNDGWAPLHLCVRHSKEEALKNLLEVKNIDPDVKGGNYGFSPLHLAVM